MQQLPVIQPGAHRQQGQPPIFGKIGIVGLGLIGGSIALRARELWPSALVIGVDNKDVLETAMRLHAIDVAADDLIVLAEADIVILAAPVKQNIALLAELDENVRVPAVVTDTGSTKREILAAAASLPARFTFIGGHPLAGAAQGGLEHARPDLFVGRPWLLTPDIVTDGGTAEAVPSDDRRRARANPLSAVRAQPPSGARAQPVSGTRAQPVSGARAQPVSGARAQPVSGTRAQPLSGARSQPLFGARAFQASESLDKLTSFIGALGADPRVLDAQAHDRLLAFLSHLPQLTASALMQVVGDAVGQEGLALAGRGLADTTRLAASPPDIWKDIAGTNADEIGPALDALIVLLQELRRDLPDGERLADVFTEAARWRATLKR